MNDPHQDRDNGQYQQDVDKSTQRVGTNHPQQPQNQQKGSDSKQHWGASLSGGLFNKNYSRQLLRQAIEEAEPGPSSKVRKAFGDALYTALYTMECG